MDYGDWVGDLPHAKVAFYHTATEPTASHSVKILFISIHTYPNSQMNSMTIIINP